MTFWKTQEFVMTPRASNATTLVALWHMPWQMRMTPAPGAAAVLKTSPAS